MTIQTGLTDRERFAIILVLPIVLELIDQISERQSMNSELRRRRPSRVRCERSKGEDMRRQRRAPRISSGFTLIELLVVVGIIAIVIAMLLPALRRARYQAEIVTCKSRLHQFYLGLSMY